MRLAVELSLEPALALAPELELESDTIPTFDMSTRSYRIPLSGMGGRTGAPKKSIPFAFPHALPSLNDEQIKSEDTAVALESSERLHSTSSGEPDAGGGPSLPSAEMTVRQMNPDN